MNYIVVIYVNIEDYRKGKIYIKGKKKKINYQVKTLLTSVNSS